MHSYDEPTRRRIDAEFATIALGAAAIDSAFKRLRVIDVLPDSDLTDIVLDARPDAARRKYDDSRRNLARRGERLSA